jgi:hypothetical protein
MPEPIRRPRRLIVATSLRERHVADTGHVAEAFRTEGWAHANRSLIIRMAIDYFTDGMRGKPTEEIVRIALERRPRRPRPAAVPAAASGGVKA